jgi:hypothetical protein
VARPERSLIEEAHMVDRAVLVFPVLPELSSGDVEKISDMFRERPDEYRESRGRLGITLERVYLQPTPMGDFAVVYGESGGSANEALGKMAGSDLPIDKDFARLVREIHGVDITAPPQGPPMESVGSWADPDATTRGRGMAFCAPLIPGAEDAGRKLAAEAYGTRVDELAASRRAFGQSVEVVTLHETPNGTITGIYIEGDDPVAANANLAASTAPYDLWFKGELAKIYPPQVDFSKPIPPVRELFDSETMR